MGLPKTSDFFRSWQIISTTRPIETDVAPPPKPRPRLPLAPAALSSAPNLEIGVKLGHDPSVPRHPLRQAVRRRLQRHRPPVRRAGRVAEVGPAAQAP